MAVIKYDVAPGAEEAVRQSGEMISEAAQLRRSGDDEAAFHKLADALSLLAKQALQPFIVL